MPKKKAIAQAVCDSLESLLHAATGRQPRGCIAEVTLRLVTNIAYYASPNNPTSLHEVLVLEDDRDKLADSIWCVLISQDAELETGISGTIPGV